MNLQWVHYNDLGGGVNLGASPSTLQPNQFASLINFYPYETVLKRRGGTRRLNRIAWPDAGPILGASAFRKSDGTNFLIMADRDEFARLDGDLIIPLTMEQTPGANATNEKWSMVQYKDFLYAARRGAGPGRVLRIDGYTVRRAGIDAPTVLPILAAVGSGVMTEGDYQLVYTFANSATDYESSPSDPVSVTLAAGGDSISVTSLPGSASGDLFPDIIRLYLTYPNQENFYYQVDELPISTTATTIDLALTAFGDLANFNLDPPPAGIEDLEVWNERVWGHDGRFLYFSEQLQGEGFGGSSIVNVYPDDGFRIKKIKRHGDRLIIGKTERVYYGTGIDQRNWDFSHVLDDKHGVLAAATMQSAHESLFWVGSGRKVFRADGVSRPVVISDPWVQSKLDALTDTEAEELVATINPSRQWYIILLPTPTVDFEPTSAENSILVYDYRQNVWFIIVIHVHSVAGGLTFILDSPDLEEGRETYLFSEDASVFKALQDDYGLDDVSKDSLSSPSPPSCRFTTRGEDGGGYGAILSRVGVKIPDAPVGTLSLNPVYSGSELAGRSLDLSDGEPWKFVKLDPTDKTSLGTMVQLAGLYAGEPIIEIQEIQLGINVLGRRPRLR